MHTSLQSARTSTTECSMQLRHDAGHVSPDPSPTDTDHDPTGCAEDRVGLQIRTSLDWILLVMPAIDLDDPTAIQPAEIGFVAWDAGNASDVHARLAECTGHVRKRSIFRPALGAGAPATSQLDCAAKRSDATAPGIAVDHVGDVLQCEQLLPFTAADDEGELMRSERP